MAVTEFLKMYLHLESPPRIKDLTQITEQVSAALMFVLVCDRISCRDWVVNISDSYSGSLRFRPLLFEGFRDFSQSLGENVGYLPNPRHLSFTKYRNIHQVTLRSLKMSR
jgi:hypothetical protein